MNFKIVSKQLLPSGHLKVIVESTGGDYAYFEAVIAGGYQSATDDEVIEASKEAMVARLDASNAVVKMNADLEDAKIRLNTLEEQPKANNELTEALAQVVLNPEGVAPETVEVLADYIPEWSESAEYAKGRLVKYNGEVYVTIGDIAEANKTAPDKAKTSYMKYEQGQTYTDAYGDAIQVEKEPIATAESMTTELKK